MLTFRLASPSDARDISALWAMAFERPGDPFFDWYFGAHFRPESVLLGEESGEIATALHLHPHTLMIRGKEIAADYIVGVTTHPEKRRRGLARALLTESLRLSRRAGRPVSLLMPSAADFYRPLGFSFCAFQWEREADSEILLKLSETPECTVSVSSEKNRKLLADIYEIFTAGRNGYALRGDADWARLIESTTACGSVTVVYAKGRPAGYIFGSEDEHLFTASEIAYTCEAGRRAVYAAMAESGARCRWYEPADDKSFYDWPDGAEHTYIRNRTFPFMMARITDPAAAFTGLRAEMQDAALTFAYTDAALPENDGTYRLLAQSGRIVCEKCEISETPALDLTPPLAAQLLFGALTPEDLHRLEKIKVNQETLTKISALFPKQNNWINEWF